MTRAASAAALLFAAACAHGRAPVAAAFPEPGRKLPPLSRPAVSAVHRGGDFCAMRIAYAHALYDVDVACATGVVLFVETKEPSVRSPEGIKVGAPAAAALAIAGAVQDRDEQSIVLPSGWIAEVRDGVVVSLGKRLSEEDVARALH